MHGNLGYTCVERLVMRVGVYHAIVSVKRFDGVSFLLLFFCADSNARAMLWFALWVAVTVVSGMEAN